MVESNELRKCPECGSMMVSQIRRYKVLGFGIAIMGAALAIFGFVVLLTDKDPMELITVAAGSIFVWAGARRARANPWFCPSCKTREFK